MPSVTLAEASKLSQSVLVQGVVEDIITVNQIFQVFPFDLLDGQTVLVNREGVLGGVVGATIGTDLTAGVAKNAATYISETRSLTKIIGDAEVDGLIQATLSDGTDQVAAQVGSKAKAVGREYQRQMILGTGAGVEFPGLVTQIDASQQIFAGNGAANGAVLSLEDIDNAMLAVTARDGQLDYIMLNDRTLVRMRSLLRGAGGAMVSEFTNLPDGSQITTYLQTPVFRNNYIPINQVRGTATNATTIFLGVFDDGTRTQGLTGLTAARDAGISVINVGPAENRDETITRVRFYCGMAVFNRRGLAALSGIIP